MRAWPIISARTRTTIGLLVIAQSQGTAFTLMYRACQTTFSGHTHMTGRDIHHYEQYLAIEYRAITAVHHTGCTWLI